MTSKVTVYLVVLVAADHKYQNRAMYCSMAATKLRVRMNGAVAIASLLM